jgi:hypothetical protein
MIKSKIRDHIFFIFFSVIQHLNKLSKQIINVLHLSSVLHKLDLCCNTSSIFYYRFIIIYFCSFPNVIVAFENFDCKYMTLLLKFIEPWYSIKLWQYSKCVLITCMWPFDVIQPINKNGIKCSDDSETISDVVSELYGLNLLTPNPLICPLPNSLTYTHIHTYTHTHTATIIKRICITQYLFVYIFIYFFYFMVYFKTDY